MKPGEGCWKREVKGEQEKDGVHAVQRSEQQGHHNARVSAQESDAI